MVIPCSKCCREANGRPHILSSLCHDPPNPWCILLQVQLVKCSSLWEKQSQWPWFSKRARRRTQGTTSQSASAQSLERWWSASLCRRPLSIWMTRMWSGAASMDALKVNHALPTWLPCTMKQLSALQHECMGCKIYWAAFAYSWSHSSSFDSSTASVSETQVGWGHYWKYSTDILRVWTINFTS